ncbi:MAG TPA: UpxY family transcription antiterminator [Candidatus Bathyarchaeia archaeon]|nr:UpxY family transcription antiterminator [Candidatus Bathyarchaeia archaeon]
MGLTMAELRLAEDSPDSAKGAGSERLWLAAYTRAQHETAVARQLEAKEVAFLLPTFRKAVQWSDRIKRVAAPLFPSYVFVHVTDDERVRVLQTAGVVHIVSACGRPAPLSKEEVAMLRACAARPQAFEPHPFLQVGQRVRVKQGPFAGWEGVLSCKKNGARLVVSLEQIMRSVSLDLAGADVEPAN